MLAPSRIAVFALPLLGLPLLAAVHAQTIEAAKAIVLLKADSSWNGRPYTKYAPGRPQLTTLKATLAPNTALPWHTHPMPNAGYVISGDLTLHDRASGVKRTYHAGQSFAESVNREHRGEAGPNGAELLITYSGVPGMPTSIPAKGEKPEY